MTFRMIVQLWNTNTPAFVSCDAEHVYFNEVSNVIAHSILVLILTFFRITGVLDVLERSLIALESSLIQLQSASNE